MVMRMRSPWARLGILVWFACVASAQNDLAKVVASSALESVVARLGQAVPDAERSSLGEEWLRKQVELACATRARVAWGTSIGDELFDAFVLPYAQANEPREDWRTDFTARFLPKVLDCKTPGEAALRLNATIFGELGVHYSTQRKRACQSPSESIEQGKASCTGLSILLADACRACCIPARLVSVTQRDLGQMIGMSRESTNKQLSAWQREGWVRLTKGGVEILSPEALDSIA